MPNSISITPMYATYLYKKFRGNLQSLADKAPSGLDKDIVLDIIKNLAIIKNKKYQSPEKLIKDHKDFKRILDTFRSDDSTLKEELLDFYDALKNQRILIRKSRNTDRNELALSFPIEAMRYNFIEASGGLSPGWTIWDDNPVTLYIRAYFVQNNLTIAFPNDAARKLFISLLNLPAESVSTFSHNKQSFLLFKELDFLNPMHIFPTKLPSIFEEEKSIAIKPEIKINTSGVVVPPDPSAVLEPPKKLSPNEALLYQQYAFATDKELFLTAEEALNDYDIATHEDEMIFYQDTQTKKWHIYSQKKYEAMKKFTADYIKTWPGKAKDKNISTDCFKNFENQQIIKISAVRKISGKIVARYLQMDEIRREHGIPPSEKHGLLSATQLLALSPKASKPSVTDAKPLVPAVVDKKVSVPCIKLRSSQGNIAIDCPNNAVMEKIIATIGGHKNMGYPVNYAGKSTIYLALQSGKNSKYPLIIIPGTDKRDAFVKLLSSSRIVAENPSDSGLASAVSVDIPGLKPGDEFSFTIPLSPELAALENQVISKEEKTQDLSKKPETDKNKDKDEKSVVAKEKPPIVSFFGKKSPPPVPALTSTPSILSVPYIPKLTDEVLPFDIKSAAKEEPDVDKLGRFLGCRTQRMEQKAGSQNKEYVYEFNEGVNAKLWATYLSGIIDRRLTVSEAGGLIKPVQVGEKWRITLSGASFTELLAELLLLKEKRNEQSLGVLFGKVG